MIDSEYEEFPTPCFNTVIVKIDVVKEEKSAGGIVLTNDTRESESLAETIGVLEAVGPLAFGLHKGLNGELPEKLQVGDRVLFRRYAGRLINEWSTTKSGVVDYRIMPDSDIVAFYRKKRSK